MQTVANVEAKTRHGSKHREKFVWDINLCPCPWIYHSIINNQNKPK